MVAMDQPTDAVSFREDLLSSIKVSILLSLLSVSSNGCTRGLKQARHSHFSSLYSLSLSVFSFSVHKNEKILILYHSNNGSTSFNTLALTVHLRFLSDSVDDHEFYRTWICSEKRCSLKRMRWSSTDFTMNDVEDKDKWKEHKSRAHTSAFSFQILLTMSNAPREGRQSADLQVGWSRLNARAAHFCDSINFS